MGSGIRPAVEYYYLDIQIQIGLAVQLTGKVPLVIASVWDQQCTAEVEYIAASNACKEAVWLKKLLSNLFEGKLDSTIIHCDNHSCIKLLENPVFHDKSKHIEMRYHFIRDLVQRGALKLQYIRTDE